MDSVIEPLKIKLARFYSGEEPIDPKGKALRELMDEAIEVSHDVEDGSAERRWLNGLFGTITDWGLPDAADDFKSHRRSFKIYRDGLPGRIPFFVGRQKDCNELDEWLLSDSPIVQIFAAGGYGKTQLVNHWLRSLERTHQQNRGSIDSVFCWCFYSAQGRAVSFGEFLSEAIGFYQNLSPEKPRPISEKRAEYLADLISNGRCILVLDGLEALQWKPGQRQVDVNLKVRGEGERFRPEYRQIMSLLDAVVGKVGAKIVITTRQTVPLFEGESRCKILQLEGLDNVEGSQVLTRLRVRGSEHSLRQIADDLKGHPLSLGLVGFALAWHYDGNASQYRKAMLRSYLGTGYRHANHDNEIVESYVSWLQESTEMQLLRLVGFFHQRKIPLSSIEALILSEELRPITDRLRKEVVVDGVVDWKALHNTLWTLKDSMLLLSDVERPTIGVNVRSAKPTLVYDAHPQLREYYASQLQKDEDGIYWKNGQLVLYRTYIAKVSGNVDSASDADAVFDAITHACQGGQYEIAFNAYWHQLHHNGSTDSDHQWYGWNRLGTYSEDLSALAWFFRDPWSEFEDDVLNQLNEGQRAMVQFAVVECLRTQGLAPEAEEPIQRLRQLFQRSDQRLTQMSIIVGSECERRLAQGEIDKAVNAGNQALAWARKSSVSRQVIGKLARLADVYMAKGAWEKANKYFEEAVQTHSGGEGTQEHRPLAGYSGFLYGEFLLTRAEIVLGNWDPDGRHLRSAWIDESGAIADLEKVLNDSQWVIDQGGQAISRQDATLHGFLWLRASGIYNILVTGKLRSPEIGLHEEIDAELAELESDFDQYARGEIPRLLVKRSKVLRRLSELRRSDYDTSRKLVNEAFLCLQRGVQVAEQGRLRLHDADLLLERTKVFLYQLRTCQRQENQVDELMRGLLKCFKDASSAIRQIQYGKRYAELGHLESEIAQIR